jgi:hypothetical protein
MAQRFTKVRVLLTSVLFICLAGFSLIQAARGQDAKAESDKAKARELWEMAIKAKGGREKLLQVKCLYLVSEDRNEPLHYFFVFPDLEFTYGYVRARERTSITIYNGKLGVNWWRVDDFPTVFRKSNKDDAAWMRFRQIQLLLFSGSAEPTPISARKKRDGFKKVDVVQTDWDGWRIDYYLDPKSHLPVKVAYSASPIKEPLEVDEEVELQDYEEISGVMLPRKLKVSHTTYSAKWEEKLRFEINPDYNPQIFENEPTPKMGPEAWRPKPKP